MSGTPSRRLHRKGRGPEADVKIATEAAAKSRRRSSNKRRRSVSEGATKRRADGRRMQRGGERERRISPADARRLVNNKLIDPLEFKAPPKKKKLADTDWAKYGRPAPRIRKEDRLYRASKLDDEALGIVSRALDNVYRIVVGSPRTESSSVPRLSLEEIQALDLEGSTDEEEDKSSPSPDLESGRPRPSVPQPGKVQFAKAKPSHPPCTAASRRTNRFR